MSDHDPCEECGRPKDVHTEGEAVYCIMQSLKHLGAKPVLTPRMRVDRKRRTVVPDRRLR